MTKYGWCSLTEIKIFGELDRQIKQNKKDDPKMDRPFIMPKKERETIKIDWNKKTSTWPAILVNVGVMVVIDVKTLNKLSNKVIPIIPPSFIRKRISIATTRNMASPIYGKLYVRFLTNFTISDLFNQMEVW